MIVPDSRVNRRDVPGDRANRARWSSVSAIMRGVGCPTVDQAEEGFFRASIEAYWMADSPPRWVNKIHTVLHKALAQAVGWSLVPRSVTEAVKTPKPTTVEMHPLSK
jgi:hypothetical protein